MIIRETAGHLNCKTFQREVSAGRKSRLLMKACCSVATLYLMTLYHTINCSMPGFPVLHYLPEFAQVHVRCTGDAIQPSHPLLSPSAFLAYESFPVSCLFASDGQSIGASASASVLPMNIQGWFPLGLTGLISLVSKGLPRPTRPDSIWSFPTSSASLGFISHSSFTDFLVLKHTKFISKLGPLRLLSLLFGKPQCTHPGVTQTWFLKGDLPDSIACSSPSGFPGGSLVKICLPCRSCTFDPWVRKIPWRRVWQPTPVFLPGESMDRGTRTPWLQSMGLQ